MPYLLDSDIVIYYSNEVAGIDQFTEKLMIEGIAMSTITLMEVLTGISASAQPVEARTRIEELAKTIPILSFSEPEARRCARIRHSLQSQGLRVRSRLLDIMIAATALEHGLTLATNNEADYRGIPDLLIETP